MSAAQKAKAEKPKADWELYNLRSQRQPAKDIITADKKIPEFVKAFLLAEIDGLPPECLGVSIDGYGITYPQGHSLMRSINITVTGIKL